MKDGICIIDKAENNRIHRKSKGSKKRKMEISILWEKLISKFPPTEASVENFYLGHALASLQVCVFNHSSYMKCGGSEHWQRSEHEGIALTGFAL